MASPDRFEHVEVRSRQELHDWLLTHHPQDKAVWLVTWKKAVSQRYVTHDDVLDELVAFGWIDGIRRRIDDKRSMQLISPRRVQPGAKSYKDRAERLLAEDRMHPAGQADVDAAKASGAWDAMTDVDALLVPDDLSVALDEHPSARKAFDEFPTSVRRNILRWIASAKRHETRRKRVLLTAQEARAGRQVKCHG